MFFLNIFDHYLGQKLQNKHMWRYYVVSHFKDLHDPYLNLSFDGGEGWFYPDFYFHSQN